jgi:hypothetical protein
MADIQPTAVSRGDRDVITWEALSSTDSDGAAYEPERWRAGFATVQATGTFDSATLVLQGSNDGTNWVTLADTSGTNISLTAAGYAEFATAFLFIRPSTSGGSGSQDIDVIVCARG